MKLTAFLVFLSIPLFTKSAVEVPLVTRLHDITGDFFLKFELLKGKRVLSIMAQKNSQLTLLDGEKTDMLSLAESGVLLYIPSSQSFINLRSFLATLALSGRKNPIASVITRQIAATKYSREDLEKKQQEIRELLETYFGRTISPDLEKQFICAKVSQVKTVTPHGKETFCFCLYPLDK